jgi:hypothetical protein
LPEVRVTESPKHGVFVVRKGTGKTRLGGRCPVGTEAPVQIAFYQSHANYVGADSVSFEVKSGSEARSYSIALTVQAGAPARKPPGTTDL